MDTPELPSSAPGNLESPAPGVAPTAPPQPFPSWKQALVTALGGVVLAVTACFGFLVTLSGNFERGGNAFWTPLAAILFCVGLLMILVGVVLVIWRALRGPTQSGPPQPR